MPKSQEKVAAALSYIFFVIPMFMKNMKTEYVMWHSKQSFFIFLATIFLLIIRWILGFVYLGFIAIIAQVICTVMALYALYEAYQWNKYKIPFIWENMNAWIAKMNLTNMFQIQK